MYKKRLHPIAIAFTICKYTWSLFPLYTIVLVNFSKSFPFSTFVNTMVLIGLFLVGVTISSFLSWKTFTYTLDGTNLIIEHGLLFHSKRSIPIDRIQSTNEQENILHRWFGLVQLQIETAGGTGPELVLRAISKEEARQLRSVLTRHSHATGKDSSLYMRTLSSRHLLFYAITSGTVGIVLSAVAGLYTEFGDYIIIPLKLSDLYTHQPLFYVGFLLFSVFIMWIIGILIVYQKYYDFRLIRQEDNLIITRGLFHKQKMIIPLGRIQAVKIEENIVRQWFGFASVRLISAGADEGEDSKIVSFPLVKIKELPFLFKHFLPDFEIQTALQRLPHRARRRYMFRTILPVLLLSITAYFFTFIKYVLPVLYLLGLWLGYRRYKDAGWMITNQQIIFRTRFLGRTTVIIKRHRIQSLTVQKTMVQEPTSLCTIKVYVKVGVAYNAFSLVDVDESTGTSVRKWYSYEKEPTVFPYMKNG
ncbi:PH domain-containing protein [Ectobacillus antri]|jgi:putative membrane protein|uniref:PH domain-containing protein n=1 Tax=Ectobacillus antri TaxID=2486280 RepID=UPI000F5B1491|nr:PH domain-containing protein [Ectobacillus antri]